ncbi:hypothetical protein [Burkholderia sp. Bp8986]|uniref:hypothetical protein n=1 Tax=Burkholderia sp. Bp8986 TaxID=2184550 RepID=UPI0039089B72
MQPGASVSRIAREHGLNDNMVFGGDPLPWTVKQLNFECADLLRFGGLPRIVHGRSAGRLLRSRRRPAVGNSSARQIRFCSS